MWCTSVLSAAPVLSAGPAHPGLQSPGLTWPCLCYRKDCATDCCRLCSKCCHRDERYRGERSGVLDVHFYWGIGWVRPLHCPTLGWLHVNCAVSPPTLVCWPQGSCGPGDAPSGDNWATLRRWCCGMAHHHMQHFGSARVSAMSCPCVLVPMAPLGLNV